jgi:chemotaxis protein CheX
MTHTVTLGDALDMTAAGPLAKELLAARGKPVALDASNVRRLGGQCLQVLLSAQSTWAADGHPFAIVEATPEFAEGLALMGATQLCPTEGALSLVQD